MSTDIQFIGGGLPVGDKLRQTASVVVTTDTTVANLTTTTGIAHYLAIWQTSGAAVNYSQIKVTVDGAAERTLGPAENPGNGDGVIIVPLPIIFTTSLVVKVTTSASGTIRAYLSYSVY